MKTLLLDTVDWDLVLDASGNIAVASEPYSLAQDAASAIRTFAREVWYDTTLGVEYWRKIMGFLPPLNLLKAEFVNAARKVPRVSDVRCYMTRVTDRVIAGQIQVVDQFGRTAVINFQQARIG